MSLWHTLGWGFCKNKVYVVIHWVSVPECTREGMRSKGRNGWVSGYMSRWENTFRSLRGGRLSFQSTRFIIFCSLHFFLKKKRSFTASWNSSYTLRKKTFRKNGYTSLCSVKLHSPVSSFPQIYQRVCIPFISRPYNLNFPVIKGVGWQWWMTHHIIIMYFPPKHQVLCN